MPRHWQRYYWQGLIWNNVQEREKRNVRQHEISHLIEIPLFLSEM